MRARTICGRTKWEVGSASAQITEHAQPVEGQSGRWGQHPITGSKDENTHVLWCDEVGGEDPIAGSKDKSTHKLRKDKVGGGVGIQCQAQR